MNRSQAGMTLIELMVALAVLGFGLVAVLSALPPIYRSAARAQQLTVGALLIGEIQARTKADPTWPPVDVPTWQPFEGEFSLTHEWKRDLTAVAGGAFVSSSGAIYLQGLKMSIRYRCAGKWETSEYYTVVANYSPLAGAVYGHAP